MDLDLAVTPSGHLLRGEPARRFHEREQLRQELHRRALQGAKDLAGRHDVELISDGREELHAISLLVPTSRVAAAARLAAHSSTSPEVLRSIASRTEFHNHHVGRALVRNENASTGLRLRGACWYLPWNDPAQGTSSSGAHWRVTPPVPGPPPPDTVAVGLARMLGHLWGHSDQVSFIDLLERVGALDGTGLEVATALARDALDTRRHFDHDQARRVVSMASTL